MQPLSVLFLVVLGISIFYYYNLEIYSYQQYVIMNTYSPDCLMLELIFPLIEMLQFLNELQQELMVAKMSFRLQVKVLQAIMQL